MNDAIPTTDQEATRSAGDRAAVFRRVQRDRLQQYLRLRDSLGHEAAWETCLAGYPEKQREKMGPLILAGPLVAGFERAVPRFAEIGIEEEVLDISDAETDAVLEISSTCMCRNSCGDIGLEPPVPLLCELDFEATRRAFPEISVTALRRQVAGAHVCIFRYARAQRHA